jgi:hypothetical protein
MMRAALGRPPRPPPPARRPAPPHPPPGALKPAKTRAARAASHVHVLDPSRPTPLAALGPRPAVGRDGTRRSDGVRSRSRF